MSAERIAVVAAHLRPAQGFGGVAESTAELIRAWRLAGRSLAVVVSDGTKGPALKIGDFEAELLGPVEIYHAAVAVRWGFGLGAPVTLFRSLQKVDRVYISGIATWPSTLSALIAKMLNRPYVIALRGGLMREHWEFIRRSKPIKRLFYEWLVFPALRGASGVHVTSQIEARDAQSIVQGVKVFEAPNVFAPPPGDGQPSPVWSELRLLYLGRLSHEKGILGFAKGFAALAASTDRLNVAGSPVGSYGQEVIAFCERTSGVNYLGTLNRDQVADAIADTDALVLPSGVDGDIRENFGNVVVEALLKGRPVLVTRGLAWDEVEFERVGVLLDRDLGNLKPALTQLRQWKDEGEVWLRSKAYADARFSVGPVAAAIWERIFDRGPLA